MNCSQVQERIWCGDLQPDIHVHLATCDACREEHQRVQAVNQEIEHTYIPLPSRSLLPSREKIEQAISRNKKSRFPAWMTTVTVAAAILLAFTQADNLWSQKAEDAAETQLSDLKAPASRSKNNPQSAATEAMDSVTIDPGSNPVFREETESIRRLLSKTFDPVTLRGLTIETYTRDTLEADTQTGRLSLWVQNQPGQISRYGKGSRPFRIQQYLELQKLQGLWTVSRISDIPFDYVLHDQSNFRIGLPNTWQLIRNEQTGVFHFQKDGQPLGGIIKTPLQKGEPDPFKAVQLPANTRVIQSGLESYRTEDAVKYLLQRTITVGKTTPPEVHTYFLRGTVAYDVWLNSDTALIPAETALAITNSFQTP